MTEEDKVANAEPFDERKEFTNVHGHKVFRYLQKGIYYDTSGAAVGAQPDVPKAMRANRKAGRKSDNKRPKAPVSPATKTVIGKQAPDPGMEATRENQRAAAAEDILS